MAAVIFVDFDVSLTLAQGNGPTAWNNFAKPPGLFVTGGVVAQLQSTAPNGTAYFNTGRTANSTAWGHSLTGGADASFTTNGTQVAINRATWGIGAEIWASCDLNMPIITATATASATAKYGIFRWGDISVQVKSVTLVVATYTFVFSVKNNGVEIATITVPNIVTTSWMFMKMNCKLHGSTGYIVCTIDGVNMSAAYTGQNTVAVNAAASTGTILTADHIYFGPPVSMDSASFITIGRCDNIYIDDASHPAGRPRGERIALGASSTDVSTAAVGTGATTVTNSLDDPTDAKACRFTGAAASTIMDLASYSTSGLDPALIGFNLYAKRPANRDANVARFLSMGLDISGVQTMGTLAVAVSLPVSSVTTPPNTDFPVHGLFEKVYNASVTTTDLTNVKVRLLTS